MTASTQDKYTTEQTTRPSMRLAKAINTYQPSMKRNSVRFVDPPMFRLANTSRSTKKTQDNLQFASESRTISPHLFHSNNERTTKFLKSQSQLQNDDDNDNEDFRTGTQIFQSKKDTKITWIMTTDKPLIKRKESRDDKNIKNYSLIEEEKDLTVLPLRLEEHFKLIVNRTRTITTGDTDTDLFSTRTFNGSEDIEIEQELAEPRISSATAVPILHADLSESTRLSRARNAFVSDFHRDRAQDRSYQADDNDDIVDGDNLLGGISTEADGPTVLDIAAITGSCLAMIILLSTIASLGFVMYRCVSFLFFFYFSFANYIQQVFIIVVYFSRKYLNPPQTLNSDKCSNPDSSGYIDDSTIRVSDKLKFINYQTKQYFCKITSINKFITGQFRGDVQS